MLGAEFVCVALLALCLNTASGQYDGDNLTDIHNQTSHTNENEYCLTQGCVLAAADILNFMDMTVDPCEDFYSFSCGGYVKSTLIPDDKNSMGLLSEISDELDKKLRILMEEPVASNEPQVFHSLKSIYNSCINKTRINELGVNAMLEVIRDVGGWPVLEENWEDYGFLWHKKLYKFREVGLGTNYFFKVSISPDLKNSTSRIISFDQPDLSLDRKHLIKGMNDSIIQAYFKFMVDTANILGANRSTVEEQMREILELEIQLAQISAPSEARRDFEELYNKLTLEEMSITYPEVPWLEYMNRLMAPFHNITLQEPVLLFASDYMDNFTSIIESVPNRTLANYLMWRAVSSHLKYLSQDVRNIHMELKKALTGQVSETPRWKECLGVASSTLSHVLGSLYVRRYFHEEAKIEALEMVKNIRAEFDKILEEIDWMDNITKEKAKTKSKSIAHYIGYPDELLNDTALQELFTGIETSKDFYLKNMLSVNKFGINYNLKKLRKPVNKTDWVNHGEAAEVNAYYDVLENSIQFPAGILQGVLFDKDRPRYLNYGAIGYVIGHEITHGFDDVGRQFNHDGNLFDWWEPTTSENFKERAQCVIEQYGNYTVPGVNLNINGILSQGENIADIGGVKESYRAYKQWVSKNGPEFGLPGLPYTPDQLFWIGFANSFCEVTRPKSLKLDVITGSHPPGKYRVIGAVSNTADFAKDFNCPVGSSMNRKDKCTVW